MTENFDEQLIVLAFIVFLVVVGTAIFSVGVWNDEAARYYIAQESLSMINSIEPHPPAYFIFLKILGNPPIALARLTSLVFSLLSAIVMLVIASELGFSKAGTVSLFLLHPLLIKYSAQATLYPMAVFFVVIAIFAYLQLHRRKLLFAAACSLMMLTHVLTGIIFLMFMFHEHFVRMKAKAHHATFLLPAFVGVAVLIRAIFFTGLTGWLQPPSIVVAWTSFILYLGSPVVGITIALLMFKDDSTIALPLAVLFPYFALLIFSYLVIPVFHSRFLLLFMPFVALWFGQAVRKTKWQRVIISGVLLSALLTYGFFVYDPMSSSKDASKHIFDGSSVLHHSTFSYYPVMYYSPESSHYLETTTTPLRTPIVFPEHVIQPSRDYFFDYEVSDDGVPSIDAQVLEMREFDGLFLIQYGKEK